MRNREGDQSGGRVSPSFSGNTVRPVARTAHVDIGYAIEHSRAAEFYNILAKPGWASAVGRPSGSDSSRPVVVHVVPRGSLGPGLARSSPGPQMSDRDSSAMRWLCNRGRVDSQVP